MMLMIVYQELLGLYTNNMENDLFVKVLIIMSLSQFRPNYYNLLLLDQYAQNKWH